MPATLRHIVHFSGGLGSWAAAKRTVAKHGAENTSLLNADTRMEDEDLYRFLDEGATNVGAELVKIVEGRDPWQVFFDGRFLGNSQVDPCSRILKREPLAKWIKERYTPETVVQVFGIGWDEEHRADKIKARYAPWPCEFPMCEPPYMNRNQIRDWMLSEGLQPPRLYAMGFVHNNCGGFCVKAGQAHFKRLLETMPERYDYHAKKEQEIREYLGKDVSILRDRTGGKTVPLTMVEFRERVKANQPIDAFEWGGCNCFAGE